MTKSKTVDWKTKDLAVCCDTASYIVRLSSPVYISMYYSPEYSVYKANTDELGNKFYSKVTNESGEAQKVMAQLLCDLTKKPTV